MITKFIIETWNPITNRYQKLGEYSKEQAEIMMYKPYVQHLTRRMIKITEEILYKEKGNKK